MNTKRTTLRLGATALLAVLALFLLSASAYSQEVKPAEERTAPAETDPTTTDSRTNTDDTELERNGQVLVREVKEDSAEDVPALTSPKQDLAPEIDEQVTRFELDRDRWLKIVKQELERVKRGATEEERRKLRLIMQRNLRLRWRALSDERKEQGAIRAERLRRKLAIKEVIDQAKEDVRSDAPIKEDKRVRDID